jgi:ethanolamine ammonia-lyase small subunit
MPLRPERTSKVDDRSRALADPFTRARLDTVIDQLRVRGVRMLPVNMAAALTDAGLSADAVEMLVEAILARIGERVSPADAPALRVRGRAVG